MVMKKPRIVIIGAGMAGLTAANKLHTVTGSKDLFELCVVEGGNRIGGRISTSEFGGDKIEMGATWIHGIGGSPIHKIAQQIHALESQKPWECMDGNGNWDEATTIAEGGFVLNPSVVDPITRLFKNLMDHAQGKLTQDGAKNELHRSYKLATLAYKSTTTTTKGDCGNLSVGSFLRQGLHAYWDSSKEEEELKGYGKWSRKLLDEAIFSMHENTQRTYTSAGDLFTLDYSAESEYQAFPGEETTIAKGYLSIIQSLASVLPPGLIQLGRKVTRIEWQPGRHGQMNKENESCSRPVKLHFCDGSTMSADHVIVTVSLGVLKAAISDDSGMFHPPLPSFKVEAISRLGFGVVDKLFMQLSPTHERKDEHSKGFPFLQMVFHSPHSELRHKKIPWWMRRTPTLCPIYNNSSVLLTWFAGEEALALESLQDEEIIKGVTETFSSFLSHSHLQNGSDSHEFYNGNVNSEVNSQGNEVKFSKILKTKWGTDPLFLGSYSHVAVGSSGDDLDTMAEPLPKNISCQHSTSPSLQILFAGEATHRTHYSTTHGAYFSGLREANRLLQYYSLC
ncbi:probable polyamine oxidase 5 [Abrus precatorius]|uniref:Probable polyamine oxidase 5 n=1 Tax=Abrus precatorius TaxID=3816 RepID=A0A8B8JHR5_ABRPR|nr:probable polyamine oxidase 5 [Abrus precatorius]XP_027330773.1 probable polyamine oxidase 5 [Abrus precatorius]XP_027330774.1 probable polyamine oxidase 5 [Abrus precatorius]